MACATAGPPRALPSDGRPQDGLGAAGAQREQERPAAGGGAGREAEEVGIPPRRGWEGRAAAGAVRGVAGEPGCWWPQPFGPVPAGRKRREEREGPIGGVAVRGGGCRDGLLLWTTASKFAPVDDDGGSIDPTTFPSFCDALSAIRANTWTDFERVSSSPVAALQEEVDSDEAHFSNVLLQDLRNDTR